MDEKKIEFSKFGTEIPADLKTDVEIATAKRRVTLKTATEQAFRMWLSGTASPSELQAKSSESKPPPEFPGDSPSSKLKSAQRAVYQDLSVKVAEVIASGNSQFVELMTSIIKVAHSETRPVLPKKAKDVSAHAQPPTTPKKHQGTG